MKITVIPWEFENPHDLSELYTRLSILQPITDDGRAMDIATICDGDRKETRMVRYGYGKPLPADPELEEGSNYFIRNRKKTLSNLL